MDHQVDQLLNDMGAAKIETSARPLMTYHEAKAEAERLDASAKEFWNAQEEKGITMNDRWRIRRDNPEAPADGYIVSLGGFWGVHETPQGVYLADLCVLAGDGRARNQDGTPYVVPEEDLQKAQWSITENNWSEW